MEHMNEEEFEKLKFKVQPFECAHLNLVKIYNRGTNTDYGCKDCGDCNTNLEYFRKDIKSFKK